MGSSARGRAVIMPSQRLAVLVTVSLAVLVACAYSVAPEEGDVAAHTLQPEENAMIESLEEDLDKWSDAQVKRREMRSAAMQDLSLGEGFDEDVSEMSSADELPDYQSVAAEHKKQKKVSLSGTGRASADITSEDDLPTETMIEPTNWSPDKMKAEKRLKAEDEMLSKLNPKVHVDLEAHVENGIPNPNAVSTPADCIDDPAWANDCAHLVEHCGTSVVMKARCRLTCGCGPKVDIYIPSLHGAPGAHPGCPGNPGCHGYSGNVTKPDGDPNRL